MKLVYILLMLAMLPVAQALEITSISPEGLQLGSLTTLALTTDELANCTYDVGSNQGSFTINQLQHQTTLTLADGEYSFIASCYTNSESHTRVSTFQVDTLGPEITISDWPEQIIVQPYQVEITLSESADCKYSEQDVNFNQMQNVFQKITSKKQFTIVEGEQQGFLKYYLACKDGANRITYSDKEFYINLPPTAKITIQENILREGIHEVILETSEELNDIPQLSYTVDGTTKSVSLDLEAGKWEGYLLIEEGDGSHVATFNFRGVDASGTIGREITKGKIFLIDTVAPKKIEDISVETDSDEIKLDWDELDDVKEYIVYRSQKPDVSGIDEYDTTTDNNYDDEDLDEGEKYYYKIAGIDDAGNLGELSDEIEVVALETDDKSEGLDAVLLFRLNQKIDDFESELFDYESFKEDVQAITNPYSQEIDTKYGVTSDLTTAINSIRGMITEMKNLRDQDLTESELNKVLQKYNDRIGDIRDETYIGIKILDEKTISLTADDAEINTAIAEYLAGTEISTEERDNYTLEMKTLQSKIRVVASMITAELKTSSGSDRITYVEKTITSDETISDASIIENIPKTLARSASDLRFTPVPIILEDDPVVQWDTNELTTQKVSYFIDEQKNTNLLSSTSTVVLTRPIIKPVDPPVITGNVVADDTDVEGNSAWKYALITLFSMMVAGLLFYYFMYLQPANPTNQFDHSKMTDLIKRTNVAADAMQTDKAKSMYIDIHKRYLKMYEEDKKKHYANLMNIHAKLQLMNYLQKGHDATHANDAATLRESVAQILQLKQVTNQNSVLAHYVDSSLKYFREKA